jgi:D-arginine dehydrogenase
LLWVATEDQLGLLAEMAEEGRRSGAESELTDHEQTLELLPALRENWVAGGLYEPLARDIDVAGLHQAYVRIARSHGVDLKTGAPVTDIQPRGSGWSVTGGNETISCGKIINASGAWGDVIAGMAGVEPIGLQPMRRTAFMVPGSLAYGHWPMTVEAEQNFYFKPDGVQFLCSLAEEVPCHPCDPRPAMEDVALAIERINEATTLGIRVVNSQWTGLRTFSPDRDLVVGEEPSAPGFYWLVGQGGVGIQTSPAYGSLLASLATGGVLAPELVEAGVDPTRLSPARFR